MSACVEPGAATAAAFDVVHDRLDTAGSRTGSASGDTCIYRLHRSVHPLWNGGWVASNTQPPQRPPIPEPMKREVRQRCGFGCVICGNPIYEYDHVIPYASAKEHEASNLSLLCDGHHRLKTAGLLPAEVVGEHNANPFNLRGGVSAPFRLYYGATEASMVVGTVETSALGHDAVAVMIDGQPLIGFRFEDGQCLLQLRLFDESNQLVLQVVDNELIYSVAPWDIEFVGNTLTLRTGLGEIFIVIRFKVPGQIYIPRGRLFYNGVEIEIWPDVIAVLNNATIFGRHCGQGNDRGAEDRRRSRVAHGDCNTGCPA